MYDLIKIKKKELSGSDYLKDINLTEKNYALCTIHRKENTNNPKRLKSIFRALNIISKKIPIVLPIHPRTKAIIKDSKIKPGKGILVIEPQAYLNFLRLQTGAKFILTDSGGLQKEAFFNSVPCITLRDETEWRETEESGWNNIVGSETSDILDAWSNLSQQERKENFFPYGKGDASTKIVEGMLNYL